MADDKNRKLLEFAGFTWTEEYATWAGEKRKFWLQPSGVTEGFIPPDLYNSLDAQKVWIMPRFWICNMTLEEGLFYVWTLGHPELNNGQPITGPADEDAAHALAEAVLKMLETQA